jgi:suppressor of tumorigenicity protein 13
MSMSFDLPNSAIEQLKGFILLCRTKPEILHKPELKFFRDFLETFGARIPMPPAGEAKEAPSKEDTSKPTEDTNMETDDGGEASSEESDVELDMDGVLENPDAEEPHEMGDAEKKEMTDEEMEQFDEARSSAMGTFSEGEWEKAVDLFTSAIKLNPNSAAMFAKRGTCFLKMNKPRACVRDCTRAIELNPDNASAYKYRGRCQRLLGNFAEAAKDLRTACKIDFDEQADEWLREVTPNAKKLEEHERKKDRKQAAKEIAEKKERIKKAQEARAAAAATRAAEDDDDDEGGLPGGMGGLGGILNDPELMAALADPEVAKAFQDITSNPANIMKYQGNPKVMALAAKLASKVGGGGGMPGMGGMGGMPGMGGMGGMPGMGGFPGFGGMGGGMPGGMGGMPGGDEPTSTPKPPPSSTDDLD